MVDGIITGQFSDSYFPIVDGVSVTISNYLSELNRTLGPSYVVAPGAPGYTDQPSAGTYRFFSLPLINRPPYRLALPQLDVSLHRVLRNLHFDLLHAHSPFLAGRYALRLARQRGIPLVATFHSKYRDKLENIVPWPHLVEREVQRISEFYASADEVWVPTENALETLREYGYMGPAAVVRHGIDFDPPSDRASLRRQGEDFLGVDPQDFLFLYVGDHAWEKNLVLLIQALSLLRTRGGRFKMAFVGEGYAAKALRSMTAGSAIAGDTIFTGLLRDRQNLSACYARADIFLFPSLYDTCGLVVKEAAAFGIPSLLVEGSAAAEEVVDGVNGFTCNNSVQAYAYKLMEILDHPKSIKRAGEGARRTLYLSWRDAVREVRYRYLSLLRRTTPVLAPAAPKHQKEYEEVYR
ncbi:MAG: glycosyltransferase [Spirochaetaceae bacterium]|nr:MAG: glycosyltransferase [Spirochaetaceae bacterium]